MYTSGWPARFGASGCMLRPLTPWQVAQICAFCLPAAASPAQAADAANRLAADKSMAAAIGRMGWGMVVQ
jgi:hypothetical protein